MLSGSPLGGGGQTATVCMNPIVHRQLSCGIELAVEVLPAARTAAAEFRFLVGMADEPADRLGLAQIVEHTLDKGTDRRDARELADAFDRLGVRRSSGTGRQAMALRFYGLPEFFAPAVELHAEMIRQPRFDDAQVAVAVELARQDLAHLHDSPDELIAKLSSAQAYGQPLGRHPLGEPETLARIGPDDVRRFWTAHAAGGRMMVVAAGPIDPEALTDRLEGLFEGFGAAASGGRETIPIRFVPSVAHHAKALEQQQLSIVYPGVARSDPDFATERVLLGVLSGGMGARLFVEVREKQGLVYGVGASHQHVRGAGMIHLGASTTPGRVDQTYRTLLAEIARLSEDLTDDELARAVTGICARAETQADITRARTAELADDLYHLGRPVPIPEKLASIRTVTIDDLVGYLRRHPRDALCVTTLGPRDAAEWIGRGQT